MATNIEVMAMAHEYARRAEKTWESLDPEEIGSFIKLAVRFFADRRGGTIDFPSWVQPPTPCLQMTNSVVYPRGHGILPDSHGAERYEMQHPAFKPYIRRSQTSGLMYSSKYPPIGIDHAAVCKCDDCKWGY